MDYEVKEAIFQVVASFAILLVFFGIFYLTVGAIEKNECEKLAEQARVYKDFFYSDYQKVQCGIE
jgi:hypothetical protein